MIRVSRLVKTLHRKPVTPADLITLIKSSTENEQEFRTDQYPEIQNDEWRDAVMRLCKAEGFSYYRFWGNSSLGFAEKPVVWGGFDVTKSGESRFRDRIIRPNPEEG